MSLDIRDMFKSQSAKIRHEKPKDKGSKKVKPIVIEDDDDFDERKSKKTAMKEEPSSSVAVKRRKRPHNRGLRFDSDSDDDVAIPKKAKKDTIVKKSPQKPSPKTLPKSPSSQLKLISSPLEFFGDKPIKRTEAMSKTTPKKATPKKTTPKKATPKKTTPKKATPKKTAPKKATPKKTTPKRSAPKRGGVKKQSKSVMSVPESPLALDSEASDIEDFGIGEAEISQVLDEIEGEMDQQSPPDEGGSSKKRPHDPVGPECVEDHTPATPPVKKLKKMADEAKSKTPTKASPSKPTKTPPTVKPAKEVKSKDTPTSPVQGSTPSVTRGSSYRAYLQRQQAGPANPGSKPIPEGKPNCLSGLTFVFTGELDSLYRHEAQDLVKQYGGKVTTSLSKKTSYLVVGREPGDSKMAKAKDLHTKILSEDKLLELIETSSEKGQGTEPNKSTSAAKTTSSSAKTTTSTSAAKTTSSSAKTTTSSSAAKTTTSTSAAKTTTSTGGTKHKGTRDKSVLASTQTTRILSSPAPTDGGQSGNHGNQLWVDKYKPTSLKQVIGQQGEKSCANKLLRWLRSWEQNHLLSTGGGKKSSWGWGGGDGSQFKAALLSGPPGIGKTTTATLACKEAGYEFTELNASDTRSRKGLEECLTTQLGNTSITAFTVGGVGVSGAGRHAVIMDEVDGMAGNEDRGGMQELIQLIKRSNIPVICICNDRQNQKIRSLVNYCFDLRFPKPRPDQIKGAMMSLAFKEGIKISPSVVEELVLSSGQDIRQVIHNLSLWRGSGSSSPDDVPKAKVIRESKLSPFDVVRKLFSCQEANLSLNQRTDLFFQDYSFVPLFVQENYISVRPEGAQSLKEHLSHLSSSADSLALGDVVDRKIRSQQAWKLLPLQAIYSCAIPGVTMRGHMSHQIAFPQWLGNNSKSNKVKRMLTDLQVHTRTRTLCNKTEFGMDYLQRLAENLTLPLVTETTDGVAEVVKCLDDYCLTREDWDSIVEICQFPGKPDLVAKIPTKVKSAFTRTYNKATHVLPYSTLAGKKTAKRKASESNQFPDDGDDGISDADSDSDAIIMAATVKVPKGKGKKTSGQSGGGRKTSDQSGGGRKTSDQRSKGTGKSKSKKIS